jgi:hypothetical protein
MQKRLQIQKFVLALTAALLINLVSKQIYFRCERFVRMSLAMSASDAAALVIYGF